MHPLAPRDSRFLCEDSWLERHPASCCKLSYPCFVLDAASMRLYERQEEHEPASQPISVGVQSQQPGCPPGYTGQVPPSSPVRRLAKTSRRFLLRKMFIVATLKNLKNLKDFESNYPQLHFFLQGPQGLGVQLPSTIIKNSSNYEILAMLGRAQKKLFVWWWKRATDEHIRQREVLRRYQPPHKLRPFLKSSPAFKGITWKGTFQSYAALSASCKALRPNIGLQLRRWYKELLDSAKTSGGLEMLQALFPRVTRLAGYCCNVQANDSMLNLPRSSLTSVDIERQWRDIEGRESFP